MSPRYRRRSVAAAMAVLMSAILLPLASVSGQRTRNELRCDDRNQSDGDARAMYCEIRERTFPAAAQLDIDAAPNGEISVHGADRSDVRLIARVEAHAETDADARALASAVRLEIGDGRVRSEGPDQRHRRSWSVSYELWVPRRSNLALQALNGGIAIDDVDGTIEARSTNGGISLDGVAGDVRGETTNGGLRAALDGDRWRGAGLDLRTTNGGITLDLPRGYSARLEAATTNGGFDFDFPITIQGRLDRHVTTRLGQGGAPIRAITTNGGVTVHER